MPKSKTKKLARKEANSLKTQDNPESETKGGRKSSDQNHGKKNLKPHSPSSKDRDSESGKLVRDTFFDVPETSNGNNNETNGKKHQKKPSAVGTAKKDFKGKGKPYTKPQPATKDRNSKPAKQKHDTFFAPPQKVEDDGETDDKKQKQKHSGKIHKGQPTSPGISKPTKQKHHDNFFVPPPEPTNEVIDEEKGEVEAEESKVAEEVPDADSIAVIETIKIPEPGETILDAKSDIAVRSGVVSIVDKTIKKRKRSKIDVVAELENDAKKMTRTGDSLGAGLEVDGWDWRTVSSVWFLNVYNSSFVQYRIMAN